MRRDPRLGEYPEQVDPKTVMPEHFTIIYSAGGDWYYISELCDPWSDWMSTEKLSEPPSGINLDIEGYMQIKLKDGTTYYRRQKPFTFWKIRSGAREQIDIMDDKVLDYPVAKSSEFKVSEAGWERAL